MSIKEQKTRMTLMKRRVRALVIACASVVVLVAAYIVVNHFVKITPFVDVDDTKYYIKYKSGSYALYDTDGAKLNVDDEYGYYITSAGTLVELDAETGKYEIVAVVDTEGNEVVGTNNRILMFPHIEKKNMRSLEVHNSYGTFTFLRYNLEKDKADDNSDFVIKQSMLTSYDQELFASLYVSAGYTLSTRKIEDPIKDENGEFTEYGLVAERRVDEDGNEYDYEPAYYIVTDKSGNRYKVLIGDKLVTGGGYYVQYVGIDGTTETKRDAVYVLSADIEDSLLQPIESFVTPTIVYPMTMTTYFDVEKFTIMREKEDVPGEYDNIVGFTYIDLSLRENTIKASTPYVFTNSALEGYDPSSNNIDAALQYLYNTSFVGVKKLSPTNADFIEYGLGEKYINEEGEEDFRFSPKYMISFYFDVLDDDKNYLYTIKELMFISAANEAGNYYVYTVVYSADDDPKKEELLYSYDMISEVEGYGFDFLTWDRYKWINSSYVNLNIAFCEEITISSPSYNAKFELDNSASDQSSSISSSELTVHATDSNGNDLQTFAKMVVTDNKEFVWTITPTSIKAVNSAGEEVKISTSYYAYNKLGAQALVVSGYISCNDGTRVYVTADTVTVTDSDGNEQATYNRYATNLFRQFYKTLLYSSIENSYPMTQEEEAALIADESKFLMSMTVKDTEGNSKVYSFYSLTSRKAYITINGSGGFYVSANRVDKFIADAQRFFADEVIDATAKK